MNEGVGIYGRLLGKSARYICLVSQKRTHRICRVHDRSRYNFVLELAFHKAYHS